MDGKIQTSRQLSEVMRRFGLMGFPLAHSFSEKYFAEKFISANIRDAVYENFPLENISDIQSLKSIPNLQGLNVTIPHKASVIPFLDGMSDEAIAIGAVNCIRISDGKWMGHNTDAFGFEKSIQPFLENKYERALILGTGGGAQAVAHVLRKWNISFHFVSREKSNANIIRYDELEAATMHYFHLIINTTPLGMFPNIDAAPEIPYEAIGPSHFLYDLIYNPASTTFLQKGKANGAHVMNGLKMLELQAERSWQIWNGEAL